MQRNEIGLMNVWKIDVSKYSNLHDLSLSLRSSWNDIDDVIITYLVTNHRKHKIIYDIKELSFVKMNFTKVLAYLDQYYYAKSLLNARMHKSQFNRFSF